MISDVLCCNNCGVPQGPHSVGHSSQVTGTHTWWCSPRCFYGLAHTAPLLLIRGLPGSGKSTLARSNSVKARWPVHLEADMAHMEHGKYNYVPEHAAWAHRWCLATTKYFLHSGHRVVVSNTFVTLESIQPYKELGFDVAIEEMKQVWGSTHNVPDSVIDHMRSRWQELP